MRAALLLSVASGALYSPVAIAQEENAETAQQKMLDTVIVTATKRGPQDVQDVPIAVTAFGEKQLEALNFQDIQSLSYTMPNVQLEAVGTTKGYANFSIRGIGVNSSIPSIDPTVGIFVDGVYMGINSGMVFDNFDIAGLEVLRGPQGVLFGRNVTGGAVLLRTTDPSEEFSADLHAGVETGLSSTVDGVVRGAILPGLRSKFAFYHNNDNGWFDNKAGGRKLGQGEQTIIRTAFGFDIGSDIDVTLRLEHGVATGDGPVSQNHALWSRDSFDFAIDEPGFYDNKWNQAFLEGNWKVGFGDGTITSITGWREYESNTKEDIDGTPNFIFHSGSFTEQDQISEELRYAGTFGPVDITTGLYYFQQDLHYNENRQIVGGLLNGSGGGIGDFSTQGAFVAADWHITDAITINAGVRYSHEEKDAQVDIVSSDPGAVRFDARILENDYDSSQTWDDTSPRLGIQWRPSDATQVYGYWAKGFRSGGYNFRQTVPLSQALPGPFDAETQNAFEIGLKQDLANGRGRVNLALFHNTIEGMQRELNTPSIGFGVNQEIVNAGDAIIQGAEFEGQFSLTDSLLLSVNVGYTDGEYDTTLTDIGNNGGPEVDDPNDLSLKLPRLAPWSYGASIIHDTSIGKYGDLSSRISINHRDKTYYTDTNLGYFEAVEIVDANFTFTPAGENYSFSIYGTNLTDETTYGGDTILPDAGLFGGDGPTGPRPLPTLSPLNKGRVVGAELRVSF
ncbi:MAG: TonB-dependent receptor [Hirschia sp.]|nr:TonB-dependent receptor [Hirschia sp.]MBF16966.1 TonB-dependent receptor [Hirschia sp.]